MNFSFCTKPQALIISYNAPILGRVRGERRKPSASSFVRVSISGHGLIFNRRIALRRHAHIKPRSSGFLIDPVRASSYFAAALALAAFSVAFINFVLKKNTGQNDKQAKISISGLIKVIRTIFDRIIGSWDSNKFLAIRREKDLCGGASCSEGVRANEEAITSYQKGSLVYQCDAGAVRSIEFPASMSKLSMESGNGSQPANEALLTTTKASIALLEMNAKTDEQDGLPSYSDMEREDLYTFYGGKEVGSVSDGFAKTDSRSFSSKTSKNLPLDIKKKTPSSDNHSSKSLGSPNSARAHSNGIDATSDKKEVASKRRDTGSGKDRKHGSTDKVARKPQASPGNNSDIHPFELYNNLVRAGRLSECVDLLEQLDRKGVLDITKVYHAEFFRRCRSKSASQDAFRFFKLIANPSLSTYNMLMSVCASCQDADGAFRVMTFLQGKGMKADCKLYTTLISTCAKSGKVDAMFEVFHEMVNSGVEPNVHTYGALIDGCARAGQVAKAFGAYGIMRSKNVKPDRFVYNALISACGQSGAVDRAFDVLAEMAAETHPMEPDHVTIGALMMACARAGQVRRAHEAYNLVRKYNIKGSPEMYTIAVNCCSATGDWNLACLIYDDMIERGVTPDEIFFSALIDVAGHAGKVDAAFKILKKARTKGSKLGIIPYSSLMGACCNSKNWQKALELYEDMKYLDLRPTVPTMNALITALCNGDQFSKAVDVLAEMKNIGLTPNTVTYSVLMVASERKGDLKAGVTLLSQAKDDGVQPSLVMYKCVIGMCVQRYEKACSVGETVLSAASGRPKVENEWTSLALTVYRDAVVAGQRPTMEVLSQVLGCLKLPADSTLKSRLVENLGVTVGHQNSSHYYSLLDGFGQYDPRAFFLLEEAASLGIVPYVSFKTRPIVVDAKRLQVHVAEVYLLTLVKGLKHRLAAGAKLPNITINLPTEKASVVTTDGGKTVNLATRNGQLITSLLRRIGIPFQGHESQGQIRISGISLRKWLQPRFDSPISKKPEEIGSSLTRIGRIISDQQRSIRTGNLSLD